MLLRVGALVWLSACGDVSSERIHSFSVPTPWLSEATRNALNQHEPVLLDVVFRDDTPGVPTAVETRAWVLSQRRRHVMATLPSGWVKYQRDYTQLPISHIRIDGPEALELLLQHPDVVSVSEEQTFEAFDTESFPLVKQPEALAAGHDGNSTAVAVLDTGTDYTLSAFGGCSAPGVPAKECRVAYAQDFAPEDNAKDSADKHGTNVSGIVVGMAPETRILALDVFNGSTASSTDILEAINWVVEHKADYNIAAMNLSLGGGKYTQSCSGTAVGAAIDTARSLGILSAVATGNNGYSDGISFPACAPAAVPVGAVYDANIGGRNYGFCTDSTTSPDQITCFSNSSSLVKLLAPGAVISAAGLAMSGTSQATPHVAGAIAALRSSFPAETADAILDRMTSTGTMLNDSRNGLSFPRLQLEAAANGCGASWDVTSKSISSTGATFQLTLTTGNECSWTVVSNAAWLMTQGSTSGTGPRTFTWVASANATGSRSASVTATVGALSRSVSISQGGDSQPPTGTLIINGGATATASTTVSLAMTASDQSGVAAMCLSQTTTCSNWESFSSNRSFKLSGTGLRMLYLWLRDTAGNTSTQPISASIIVDTTAPTNGALTLSSGNGSASLSWTGFSDAGSGINHYIVVYATGTAPATCTQGTQVYSGNLTQYTHSGITNGVTAAYRVCAVDKAGNISKGVTASTSPRPEKTPPTGTVVINANATWTNSPRVTLTLSAVDDSGVAQMCVSLKAPCTAWKTYATTTQFAVGSTGVQTVYVWFRDIWGNASVAAATDSIQVDTVRPTDGTLTSRYQSGSVALTWTAGSDSGSGVAGYRLVAATVKSPATCSTGTIIYDGLATSYVHTELTNGTTWFYRLCTVDVAGNVSKGLESNARPRPENEAPSGNIVIHANATYATQAIVTVSASATDSSGVQGVCLSQTATSCTSWIPYSTSLTFKLSGNGRQTLYAWFRDTYGNVSSTPTTDDIFVDTIAPRVQTLTVTGGSQKANVSWTAAIETGSGLLGYRLVVQPGRSAPANCSSGRVVYQGAGLSTVVSGLSAGVHGFRLCAIDVAGNVGGNTRTATVLP